YEQPLITLPTPRPPTPQSTLFPYTTLFRSGRENDSTLIDHEGLHLQLLRLKNGGGLSIGRDAVESGGSSGGGKEIARVIRRDRRSEEHTSELQSRGHLVCRLLLEKKNNKLN